MVKGRNGEGEERLQSARDWLSASGVDDADLLSLSARRLGGDANPERC